MSRLTKTNALALAAKQVGYVEKRSNAKLDSKTANAGSANYTKFGRDMHRLQPSNMDFPAPWCDCFVDWCFWKTCGDAGKAKTALCGDFDDYTVNSARRYKDAGRWHDKPKAGDQIFFKSTTGGICHTGLVERVAGGYVHTIEGNTSGTTGVVANGGSVARKLYAEGYIRIAGYGRPRYEHVTAYIPRVTRYLYPEPKKQVKKRICKIPRNAEVEYLGEKSGNWRKVKYKGKTGWMGITSAGVSCVKRVWEQ